MSPQVIHIAAAIIRQGDTILLVQQQGRNDPGPTWALPGGVVEPGEFLTEALTREIKEETGLTVNRIGSLAYVAQLDDPSRGHQSMAFIFEVTDWIGSLRSDDPDRVILDLCFFSWGEAVQNLQTLPWLPMREPATAYLRGQVPAGSVWFYRQTEDEQIKLIGRTGAEPPTI